MHRRMTGRWLVGMLIGIALAAAGETVRLTVDWGGLLWVDGMAQGYVEKGVYPIHDLTPGVHRLRVSRRDGPAWELALEVVRRGPKVAAEDGESDEAAPEPQEVLCPSRLFPTGDSPGMRAVALVDWETAAAWFDRAETEGQSLAGTYALVKALQATAPERALALAEQVAVEHALTPQATACVEVLSRAQIEARDYSAAAQLLGEYLDRLPDADEQKPLLLVRLVICEYRLGDFEASQARAQECIAKYRHSRQGEKMTTVLQVIRSKVLRNQSGEDEDAARLAELEANADNPENGPAAAFAATAALAREWHRRGDDEAARRYLAQAEKLAGNADEPMPMTGLMSLYVDLELAEEAAAKREAVVASGAGREAVFQARVELGCLRMARGRAAEGEAATAAYRAGAEAFQAAAEGDRQNVKAPAAVLLAGHCLIRAGDRAEAVEVLGRVRGMAHAKEDVKAEAAYWRASALVEMGRDGEGYRAFKELVKEYPHSKWGKFGNRRRLVESSSE